MTPFASILAAAPVDPMLRLAPHYHALLQFYGVAAGFVSTLYALYTRDNELRQSRRELFRVLIMLLVAFMCQCAAWLMVEVMRLEDTWPALSAWVALALFVVALVYFLVRVVVLSYLRIEKFKERPFFRSLKHLPLARYVARKLSLAGEKRHETTVQERAPTEKYSLLRTMAGESFALQHDRGVSFLLGYSAVSTWLAYMARLAMEHLANGETVTLITCRHHPSHVLRYLKNGCSAEQQEKLRTHVVLVDAFTQSFGGDDEVFAKFLQAERDDGYTIFPAATLPGVHSGAAKAFKHFKSKLGRKRIPSTIVYDGLLVYRHCEAEDQLTRFLIHMIEAERTYSMLTLLGEPQGEEASLAFGVAASLVDYVWVLPAADRSLQRERREPEGGICD